VNTTEMLYNQIKDLGDRLEERLERIEQQVRATNDRVTTLEEHSPSSPVPSQEESRKGIPGIMDAIGRNPALAVMGGVLIGQYGAQIIPPLIELIRRK
jgi:Mg2+ and Co2+ transporter CorA